MCGAVLDVITLFKFDVDRFRVFLSLGVYESGFSIEKASPDCD